MKTRARRSRGWQQGWLLILVSVGGCGKMSPAPQRPQDTSQRGPLSAESEDETFVQHTTTIRTPPPVVGAVFRVSVAAAHSTSHEGQLKCAACHSLRPSKPENAKAGHLDEFHQGLWVAHGQLSCISCHNPGDSYSSLRLADGQAIPFAESIVLCAQCHGPQYRDYERGAHGGMTGYWDLKRGGRVRNHCQHCHDPHAPNYPKFNPAPPPRDRFSPRHAHQGSSYGD